MRFLVIVVLSATLGILGCDSSSGSAGSGGAGGSGGSGGGGGGQPPVITMLAWDTADDCVMGTASDYTVTVTAEDPDTPSENLTYDGSVTACTGEIDDVTSTVNCPNNAPYPGMVVVTDGNQSDTVTFRIGVCDQDQSCTTDPDTCTAL